MDFLAIVGIVLGFAAILGGNFLEGGHLGALADTPAGVIVIGGTLGAALLQTPLAELKRAVAILRWVWRPPVHEPAVIVAKMSAWSRVARKDGLLGLERLLEKENDPFTRKGLSLLVDGAEPAAIRQVLETEMIASSDRDHHAAGVYNAMGGYAPTIGIIGAVMGLIHVLRNLADPDALGAGIATAFVATIYGVGLANLLLLPVAGRLATLVDRQQQLQAMVIDGLLAIAEGEHPKSIELRLSGFDAAVA